MQSEVFDVFYEQDQSALVCAPTGAGKTVLFELAIFRWLLRSGRERRSGPASVVYISPSKYSVRTAHSLRGAPGPARASGPMIHTDGCGGLRPPFHPSPCCFCFIHIFSTKLPSLLSWLTQ